VDKEAHRHAETLRVALKAVGDDERAVGAKAYLKSDLEFYGVGAKPLRVVARSFLAKHPDMDRIQILALVQALWAGPIFEMKAVAVAVLERSIRKLETSDLELVEDLLRRSHTWALVDWLCAKIAAPLIERETDVAEPVLRRWSIDPDFWIRRASMLSLLPALRAGGGDFDLFASFASRMVSEKEFFIRKAIGWVLRDVSKKRPQLAFDFLSRHLDEVSGLTLREGSKYLPQEMKVQLMREVDPKIHAVGRSSSM
jgi:3-methyladenine DNA glycosylase AlkD